jgi:transforming growth factor-beta-induced protein
MKHSTNKFSLFFVLAALVLFLAACGSNDSSTGVNESSSSDDLASSSAELGSIVDIAVADGRFETLVAAVGAAGLAETLSGEGSFTVLAPTDDAFGALPEGTVEALLADPEGDLKNILLYHVLGSVAMASDVVQLSSATTLQGSAISIEVVQGDVILNGSAKVIITDIQASNGVIHVLDAVLLPPAEQESESNSSDNASSEQAGASSDDLASSSAELGSIVDIAVADGRFETLVAAVGAAGLAETLSGEGSFTVLAPTDDAFGALPEGTVEALLEDPEGDLKNILLYHVLGSVAMASDVVQLSSATTLQGSAISIEVVQGDVILNGSAKVIITDIQASNGVIHVLDAVLLPPAE